MVGIGPHSPARQQRLRLVEVEGGRGRSRGWSETGKKRGGGKPGEEEEEKQVKICAETRKGGRNDNEGEIRETRAGRLKQKSEKRKEREV